MLSQSGWCVLSVILFLLFLKLVSIFPNTNKSLSCGPELPVPQTAMQPHSTGLQITLTSSVFPPYPLLVLQFLQESQDVASFLLKFKNMLVKCVYTYMYMYFRQNSLLYVHTHRNISTGHSPLPPSPHLPLLPTTVSCWLTQTRLGGREQSMLVQTLHSSRSGPSKLCL